MYRLLILSIMIVLLPLRSYAEDELVLTDIQDSYAVDEIQYLVENAVINGYQDHTFRPRNSITRAEFAVMLAKSLELEENAAGASPFPDVPTWAKGYVGALVTGGFAKGVSDTSFGANQAITRQEMAALFIRAMELDQYVLNLELPVEFADSGRVAPWAKPYVAFAQQIGFIKGDGTSFYPAQRAERQAVAKLMYDFNVDADWLVYNVFEIILKSKGVQDIEDILFVNDNQLEVIQTDGGIVFFTIDTGDVFTDDRFTVKADVWQTMDFTAKMEFVSGVYAHWLYTGQIEEPEEGVNMSQVIMDMDEYLGSGEAQDRYLYEVYREILTGE